MQPLIVTITFLTLLCILLTGKIKEYVNQNLVATLDTNYKRMQSKVQEEREVSLLHELKKQEAEPKEIDQKDDSPNDDDKKKPPYQGERKSPSLNFNMARPPNNSRLNLHVLIHEPNGKQKCYEIAARLLRRLYGHMNFFKKTPLIEYKILDAMIAKKEETFDFLYPDELAGLNFNDPILQEAFSYMLKGYINCPSLLYYITFEPGHKKINFMFASEALIESAIDDPKIAKRALKTRSFYWDLINDQEDHRKERHKNECYGRARLTEMISGDIAEIFSRNGSSINPKEIFDFSLGTEGNILIVTDKNTLVTVREKTITFSKN